MNLFNDINVLDDEHLPYVTNRWYHLGRGKVKLSSTAKIGKDKLVLYPFYMHRPAEIGSLGLFVGGTGGETGSEFKLAIYEHNHAGGVPKGAPLVSVQGTSQTGGLKILNVGQNYTLPSHNVFWAAINNYSNNARYVARSPNGTEEAWLIGSTDPKDLFGAGAIGTYNLRMDHSFSSPLPNLTGKTRADFIFDQTAKNAALIFRVA